MEKLEKMEKKRGTLVTTVPSVDAKAEMVLRVGRKIKKKMMMMIYIFANEFFFCFANQSL